MPHRDTNPRRPTRASRRATAPFPEASIVRWNAADYKRGFTDATRQRPMPANPSDEYLEGHRDAQINDHDDDDTALPQDGPEWAE